MYKIKLPNFEGPFDLLLYFIKRDELNIYDIPISKITAEFLKYIQLMHHFDIELAGEFVVMAANLMYIKTQMLLPRPNTGDEDFMDDPRKELIQNILEYKQIKEAAAKLGIMADTNKYFLYKSNFDAELAQAHQNAGYKNATLTSLLIAYGTALARRADKTPVHVVEIFNISVKDKIAEIEQMFTTTKRFTFSQLVRAQNKQHIIVTFLAILEMMKLGQLFITQQAPFEDFTISATGGGE